MKKALITGITGQDGSYLAELLCAKGYYGSRFVSVMPTNLYGPNDNFDLETSHVLPALIHRFHEAKQEGLQVSHFGGRVVRAASLCMSTIWPTPACTSCARTMASSP